MPFSEKKYFLYHIRDRENSCGFGNDGYIGITNNYYRRKKQHFDALFMGNHTNERLQAAYNKSSKSLEFYIINSGTKEEIEARERLLVPKPNHYWNKQTGGGPGRGMSIDKAINTTSWSRYQSIGGQGSAKKVESDSSNSSNDNKNSSFGTGSKSYSGRNSNNSSKGKEVAGATGIGAVVTDIAATVGIVATTFGSGLGTAYIINKSVLKDDSALDKDERNARSAGRVASYTGGGIGATGAMVAIYGAGEVGLGVAGISSGLTAIGGTVGGAGAVGLGAAILVPAAAAIASAGVVYGGYKFYKWLTK